jgi:hypothetical protein
LVAVFSDPLLHDYRVVALLTEDWVCEPTKLTGNEIRKLNTNIKGTGSVCAKCKFCSIGRFCINSDINGEENSHFNYFNLGIQFDTTQTVRMNETGKQEILVDV